MSTDPQEPNQTASRDPLAKEPTEHTLAANQKVMQEPNFPDETHDYSSASRGFIATLDGTNYTTTPVYNAKIGTPPVWDLAPYGFLTPPTPEKPAPATVNPSLWRQAKINMNNGLFHVTTRTYDLNGTKVSRGIYQVRAFDLSNMTIVETDRGIIVIDPLISRETASAALELYKRFRGSTMPQPLAIKAVIYTHSHIDHYGGVLGVVTQGQVDEGKIPIYAPDGFLDHAISENAFAGNAMGRRATYMYGSFLLRSALGQVDGGLGKGVSTGNTSLIAPTHQITQNLEGKTIDGVRTTFMLAQDTEAPSEMLLHFPDFKAMCAAEDMTHNLHNLYSIRGSQVRNAMAWWKVINDVIKLFAADTDVLFAQHHWPMWKTETDIVAYLKSQRDLYKYILDQSLRLLNHGRTMLELSEMLVLPESLSSKWYNRGYYGTVNHDSKAVYQRYLGWYDANPANLHPPPPVEASRKYVEFMGGAAEVLRKARIDYNNGQYRWVSEVVNHVIFADPDSNNQNPGPLTVEAKQLQADALEQMGYQAESGPWRNAYLMGASELRHGKSVFLPATVALNPSVINAMTLDQYFDYMGLRFNAPKAEAELASSAVKSWTIKWLVSSSITSSGGNCVMEFMDYTLPYTTYNQGEVLPSANVTVTLSRDTLNSLTTSTNPVSTFNSAVSAGQIQVAPSGEKDKVTFILGKLDFFPANFNIVTPRPDAS